MRLVNLPEDLLASLPPDCWHKARVHWAKSRGYPYHHPEAVAKRRRLGELRKTHGKFYVTGAFKTPPKLSYDVDTQHKAETLLICPV